MDISWDPCSDQNQCCYMCSPFSKGLGALRSTRPALSPSLFAVIFAVVVFIADVFARSFMVLRATITKMIALDPLLPESQ